MNLRMINCLYGCIGIFLLLFSFHPASAQEGLTSPITLQVEMGFGGYFRENEWMLAHIRVENQLGQAVQGRLVVRPETSGDGIINTFSTPVALANGAVQNVSLYLTSRGFTNQVRVEFIADDGAVMVQQTQPVQNLAPYDRLHLAISESLSGAPNTAFSQVSQYRTVQVEYALANLPDFAAALQPVDLIVMNDVDTANLSSAQRQALNGWLLQGGHLIVAGGANTTATTSGVLSLLPVTINTTQTLPSLEALGAWIGDENASLAETTLVGVGIPLENASVLVEQDGIPLIVRHAVGYGTVDWLAPDPSMAPLQRWDRLTDVWHSLITSRATHPSWTNGVSQWDSAKQAIDIFPGVEPLPDILPLLIFLIAYIVLMGPLNYLVLRRINRLEWAWLTIPAFILIFSILAYFLGTNLRGTNALINTLTVVDVIPNQETAHVESVIGVFSPQRGQYSLVTSDDTLLRTLPVSLTTNTLFNSNLQSSVEISETNRFLANEFNLDSSIIAGFNLSGTAPAPAISGAAVMEFSEIDGQQTVRGSVRNESGFDLIYPTILARGISLRLGDVLSVGGQETFNLTLSGESFPSAMPALSTIRGVGLNFRVGFNRDNVQTVRDLMGEAFENSRQFYSFNPSEAELAQRQEQFFLTSLIDDAFNSTGRGDHIILAGWLDTPDALLPVQFEGNTAITQNRTLVFVQLSTDVLQPTGEVVTIGRDRFTWSIVSMNAPVSGIVSPDQVFLQTDENAVFQFTPLPEARLRQVDRLTILLSNFSSFGQRVPIELWNWRAGTWDAFSATRERYAITDYVAYIGPENAVRVRISPSANTSSMRGEVSIEQQGRF